MNAFLREIYIEKECLFAYVCVMQGERVCVCVSVREGEREREDACAYACVREGGRERVSMYMGVCAESCL